MFSNLSLNQSYQRGFSLSVPFIFSGFLFGIIFGFLGASLGLSLLFLCSMSLIIAAAASQFIVLALLSSGEPFLAIVATAVLINVRFLLFGAILNEDFRGSKKTKMMLDYLMSDEAFLITKIALHDTSGGRTDRLDPASLDASISANEVYLAAGISMWLTWNLATVTGYMIFHFSSFEQLVSPNIVIAASFLGYLIQRWANNPQERWLMFLLSGISVLLASRIGSSWLFLSLLLLGSLFSNLRNGESRSTDRNQLEDRKKRVLPG